MTRVQQTDYGTYQIGVPDTKNCRKDEYTSNYPNGTSGTQITHVLNAQDDSDVYVRDNALSEGECSFCYFGYAHSVQAHVAQMVGPQILQRPTRLTP